jgi:hypothetical protein
VRTVFYGRVYSGLKALKLKAMLLFSLPSFLAVLVLCPSFLLSLKTNVLVSNLPICFVSILIICSRFSDTFFKIFVFSYVFFSFVSIFVIRGLW